MTRNKTKLIVWLIVVAPLALIGAVALLIYTAVASGWHIAGSIAENWFTT